MLPGPHLPNRLRGQSNLGISGPATSPLSLESSADQAREHQQQQRGADAKKRRFGEGLVQPSMLIIDGLCWDGGAGLPSMQQKWT